MGERNGDHDGSAGAHEGTEGAGNLARAPAGVEEQSGNRRHPKGHEAELRAEGARPRAAFGLGLGLELGLGLTKPNGVRYPNPNPNPNGERPDGGTREHEDAASTSVDSDDLTPVDLDDLTPVDSDDLLWRRGLALAGLALALGGLALALVRDRAGGRLPPLPLAPKR